MFSDHSALLVPLTNKTRDVAVGDFDLDGDPDVAVIAAGRATEVMDNRLNETGAFGKQKLGVPILEFAPLGVVAADLDRDGDEDVLVGNFWLDRLFVNTHRQLASRRVPRVGKPLQLELRGPQSEPWILARAFGTGVLPLPPIGTLYLDPGTLKIVGAGVLDAEGVHVEVIPVPASPALVGLEVWWQAALGLASMLSNPERTALTGL